MRLFKGLGFLTVVATAVAEEPSLCGSTAPPPEALAAAQALQSNERLPGRLSARAARNETLVISTYAHIIEREQDAGSVTDKRLNDQMKVLNKTFAPHGIQFALLNVTHTVNNTWASSTRNRDKQTTLRQGSYQDLNIYFESDVGTRSDSVTGICEFPVKDPHNTGMNGTAWTVWDGCHVGANTMPGGPGVPGDPANNQGKTATHEVGHWFGLFHVFQGNDCDGDGDLIDDTPVMLSSSLHKCDIGQDSCPDHPGLDPIHNYMDYSTNPCQYEFTPLQEERMYNSFNTLRRGV